MNNREEAKKRMQVIHICNEYQKQKIENTREKFIKITEYILENMNDSREKSLVLTKLEEACMWSIKGITRE